MALPFAGGDTEAGANAQLTPAGLPAQDRPTLPVKPKLEITVQVAVSLPPWAIARLDGAQLTVKSGWPTG